jgi:phosphoribosylformimino-5-aminoimidazole carboxamide ribotide isomerase
MLVPSIDLLGGRVVQLEQGERLRWASDDLDAWVARFARFPIVQVIDLDAARRTGDNDALVRQLCARRPCQVGGGVRSVARARALLDAGAARVIVGSSLFADGAVDVARAAAFTDAVGLEHLIAAVDSRAGRVVVSAWREQLPLTPADAIRALEPFAGAFLYTHVDTEGLLGGFPLAAIEPLRAITTRRLIAAGGIRHQDEIDRLDRLGIDAVVGMAIYTGLLVAEQDSPD